MTDPLIWIWLALMAMYASVMRTMPREIWFTGMAAATALSVGVLGWLWLVSVTPTVLMPLQFLFALYLSVRFCKKVRADGIELRDLRLALSRVNRDRDA